MVNDWLKSAQFRLFPPVCSLCHGPGLSQSDLCEGCRRDLPFLTQHCQRCAMPLSGAGQTICGRCLQQPPRYDRVVCPFLYHRPVSNLLHLLKFNHRLQHARLLSTLFLEHLTQLGSGGIEAILPVPLHQERVRERGYNQALELAAPVAKGLELPLLTHACRRVRATDPQTALDAAQRRRNIKGAFQLEQPIRQRRVAIFDDVMTTGSTLDELTRVLRRGGVEYVEAWVMARVTL
ncbi:MAG: ComF family protein [Pseudomonadota bacterium]